MSQNPILTVLLYSSVAAAAGALGALPFLARATLSARWLGWANALAAGLMLGAAYVLADAGLPRAVWPAAGGAAIGIGFIFWTHLIGGTADLDLNRLDQTGPEYGYQIILVQSLHSASEGVAIGVAMSLNLGLGAFTALALAAHNVPEAAVLCAVLRSRGTRLKDAATLAVVANASQVLLAVATFAVIGGAPTLLPWALGLAVGALVYLVMMELLPQSYRQAGHTSIALVTSVALGMVVLLNGYLV